MKQKHNKVMKPKFQRPSQNIANTLVGRRCGKIMKITIEIFEESPTLFGCEIFINGNWLKDISGLPTKEDVIKAVGENEDLLLTIKNNEYA